MCFKCFHWLENICLSTNIICFACLIKKSVLLNTSSSLVQDMAGRGFERQGTGLGASSHGALTRMFVGAVLPWAGWKEITGECTSHTRASRGNTPIWKSPEQMRCFWRMKDIVRTAWCGYNRKKILFNFYRYSTRGSFEWSLSWALVVHSKSAFKSLPSPTCLR